MKENYKLWTRKLSVIESFPDSSGRPGGYSTYTFVPKKKQREWNI